MEEEAVNRIVEGLRQEPYNFIKNNCIIKSVRFRSMCRAMGIPAKTVVCIGTTKAKWFGYRIVLPAIHSWGEVKGRKIEVSRPLGQATIFGIVPMNIKPVIAIRV